MSPLSWPVVIGTLVVGSPALYAAQVAGTLSPDVAVVRLGICMAAVWLACSVVASLTESAVASNKLAAAAAAETAKLTAVPADHPDAPATSDAA